MIDRIGDAALAKGRAELASLRAFAAENGFAEALAPWDLAFWSRRQLEALYGYSPETLRPYFPFPRVLEGLFGLARELFGVAVEPADGEAPVWHPDVRFFRVRGEDGAVLAHFYLDPYSRPAPKRGGAWMDELRSRERRPDGSLELPLALRCCNQAPPAGGMLTRVDDPECAGINNVEWDAVELASQFMENWCREPGPLRALSRHVDTGEPLPDDLISRIRGAATFGTGRATMRQLSFALMDMDLHEKVPCAEMPDADAAQRAAFDRFADLPPLPENRFLRSFTHIFSGGYAAGYYSYMWADILAHDAFGAFEDAGLDDPAARAATGRRYAATVLALGGSRPPADVFRAFRGRDPSPPTAPRSNAASRTPTRSPSASRARARSPTSRAATSGTACTASAAAGSSGSTRPTRPRCGSSATSAAGGARPALPRARPAAATGSCASRPARSPTASSTTWSSTGPAAGARACRPTRGASSRTPPRRSSPRRSGTRRARTAGSTRNGPLPRATRSSTRRTSAWRRRSRASGPTTSSARRSSRASRRPATTPSSSWR